MLQPGAPTCSVTAEGALRFAVLAALDAEDADEMRQRQNRNDLLLLASVWAQLAAVLADLGPTDLPARELPQVLQT